MNFSLPGTIALWTLALWALGWLVLPVSRRVFAALPDGGLAAGRVLFIVLVALAAFWGAALHLVPLKLAPAVAGLAALACAAGWRDAEARGWARAHWKTLAFSDAIFLLAWAAFLWVRLQHPELHDLEKPMDVALIGAAWKTDWLPFAHPWWGGANFTNYYYFGPLMGALMGRALGAPPQVAYNLVQPAFCAFFLSSLWALGAALTRSKSWGVAVVLLVGLGGPLEPLRQWSEKGWSWPFDWWTTSRVIPNTINEYPAFTLAIGDAHAHFYALSFAALWLSLAWSLFANSNAPTLPQRRFVLIIAGLILGAWLMTNTWDAPIFGLLFGLTIYLWRPGGAAAAPRNSATRILFALSWLATFAIAVLAAAPYFWRFKSPVGGAKFDPWLPDLLAFCLLWGGWIVVGALTFLLPAAAKNQAEGASDSSHVPDGLPDASARFRRLLIGAGMLALVAPFLFYIKGAFGDGELRHQDTVFKFGLQAWILLGVGLSAELGARLLALTRVARLLVACALVAIAPVLVLAPATTIWTRALTQNTARDLGVSLDGMRYLPSAEQSAILWLQKNGRAGEIVMEGVPMNDGAPGGDYDATWGRIGAFSGLSSTLGWPQHVWGWDGNYDEVMARGRRVAALYDLPTALDAARGAAELGARYTFFGRQEAGGNWQTPDENAARAAGFAVHAFEGSDNSRALILERIGR